MDDWYLLLSAAVRGDREACKKYSLKLGYLTGEESPVGFSLGSPAALKPLTCMIR